MLGSYVRIYGPGKAPQPMGVKAMTLSNSITSPLRIDNRDRMKTAKEDDGEF